MAKYTAAPFLVANVTIVEDSGKVSRMELKEGQILDSITFKSGSQTLTKTGKIDAIMVETKASKVDTNVCPCRMESAFIDAVSIVGIALDASGEFGSDTYFIKTSDIKSIGDVVDGKVTVDVSNMEEGAMAKAISELKPGQEVVLGEGTITEELVIPEGVVLRGAQSGVVASSGYRAQDEVEGETIIAAPITLTSGTSVLEGITLAGGAIPKLGNATSNEEVVVQMKNCRVVGLDDANAEKINAFMAAGNNKETKVRFEVENCYFGNNGGKMYNLFNMHGKWMSGSYIRNCYFAKDCCQNTITIYNAEDGAIIDIVGNVWEDSKNGVRIVAHKNFKAEVNMTNNTWLNTEMPNETAEGLENWGGLFMIQTGDGGADYEYDLSEVVVNMKGNVNKSENAQVWYYYANAKHPALPVEDRPKVYVEGTLDTYEGKEYIFA